ncbi:MAG: thioredoxin-dependent thiol peroxidase [Planctomycetota bacterium]
MAQDTEAAATIEVGKKAPAFTLADQDGNKHKLSDYKGKAVVLFFYPKDDTSGCTKEACQFRDLSGEMKKAGAVVLGVSPQDQKSKAKFAAKHDLNFPLLADVGEKVCAKYGVWAEKSMYGKKYMGVVRTTYLIDAAGKVAQRWDKVKVPNHGDAVLAAVREL